MSANFFRPSSPHNPSHGKWQHVGLLGATAPAVNGLGTVKFAGEEEGMAFTLDFASDDYAWEVRSWRKAVARLIRGIREYMVAEKGVEAADQAMKDWDVDAAVNPPPETQENTASYSEAPHRLLQRGITNHTYPTRGGKREKRNRQKC